MQIKLSKKALDCLTDIYEYYRQKGIGKHGRKIRAKILAKSMLIKGFPKMGQVEENLSQSGKEFRFLIEGNYKIIYLVLEDHILVTDVFDTRQDPEKM